ncbi:MULTISPECIES: hypothetical protein [Vibrio]|uniref:hypothetical protein n=1 Tax=Vibrio TaxID=662 RepID=UPI00148D60FF|nr:MULTISPECIES: hypothetical protein [Vibrio]
MKLSDLTDGERFKIARSGQTGRLIGVFGKKYRRVVVLDEYPDRLTNFHMQIAVQRL